MPARLVGYGAAQIETKDTWTSRGALSAAPVWPKPSYAAEWRTISVHIGPLVTRPPNNLQPGSIRICSRGIQSPGLSPRAAQLCEICHPSIGRTTCTTAASISCSSKCDPWYVLLLDIYPAPLGCRLDHGIHDCLAPVTIKE